MIVSKDQVIKFIKPLFGKRNDFSNKSDFGHGVVIGGSFNYVGAPQFAAESSEKVNELLGNLIIKNGESAMSVGLGTSGLAVPEFLASVIHPNLRYSALYPLESDGKNIKFNQIEIENLARKANAFAIGMGMADGEAFEITQYLLDNTNCNLIIDADALYKCKDLDFKDRAILTPHIGEFSRMTGLSKDYIQMNQEQVAMDYSLSHHCVLILKNAITTISNGYTAYTMRFGNSKLSKGGSGDVLSGILLGLVASNLKANKENLQGYEKIKADEDLRNKLMQCAVAGNYILGRCAELSPINEFSHKPEDIVAQIGNVISELI